MAVATATHRHAAHAGRPAAISANTIVSRARSRTIRPSTPATANQTAACTRSLILAVTSARASAISLRIRSEPSSRRRRTVRRNSLCESSNAMAPLVGWGVAALRAGVAALRAGVAALRPAIPFAVAAIAGAVAARASVRFHDPEEEEAGQRRHAEHGGGLTAREVGRLLIEILDRAVAQPVG